MIRWIKLMSVLTAFVALSITNPAGAADRNDQRADAGTELPGPCGCTAGKTHQSDPRPDCWQAPTSDAGDNSSFNNCPASCSPDFFGRWKQEFSCPAADGAAADVDVRAHTETDAAPDGEPDRENGPSTPTSEPASETASAPASDDKPHLDPLDIVRQLAPGQRAAFGLPADAGDEPASAPARFVDLDIRFRVSSAELSPVSHKQLTALGDALMSEQLRAARLLIAGHTDATGPAAFNMELSRARAWAVIAYLIDNFSLDPDRLQAEGFGETQLKDAENPAAEINRRVEVRLLSMAGPVQDEGVEK